MDSKKSRKGFLISRVSSPWVGVRSNWSWWKVSQGQEIKKRFLDCQEERRVLSNWGFLDWFLNCSRKGSRNQERFFWYMNLDLYSWFSWCSIRLLQEDSRKGNRSRKVLDWRFKKNKEVFFVLRPQRVFFVLRPQEVFLVLGVSKKGIWLAIDVLKELVPPREADQASAPCELPVEARHVCGLWSSIFHSCRGAAAKIDGLGIWSVGDSTTWGFDPQEICTYTICAQVCF